MTEEHNHEQARNVKGREKRRPKRQYEDRHVVFVSERENRIFTEESAERRATHECERADQKSHKGNGEISGQTAHFPNVLFVMKRDDDRTGAEEKQRFE